MNPVAVLPIWILSRWRLVGRLPKEDRFEAPIFKRNRRLQCGRAPVLLQDHKGNTCQERVYSDGDPPISPVIIFLLPPTSLIDLCGRLVHRHIIVIAAVARSLIFNMTGRMICCGLPELITFHTAPRGRVTINLVCTTAGVRA